MLSALILSKRSYWALLLAEQPIHQRFVHPGPLVLRTAPLKFLTPTTDRDRTVSRRSEPSSRASLMGEQPNPWDILQPQDETSRHRGAKHPVDVDSWGYKPVIPEVAFIRWAMALPCGTTGSLSPTFVSVPLVGVTVKPAFAFVLFEWFPTILSRPLNASVTL